MKRKSAANVLLKHVFVGFVELKASKCRINSALVLGKNIYVTFKYETHFDRKVLVRS